MNRPTRPRLAAAAVLLCAVAPAATMAQATTKPADQEQVVRMEVSPAAPPDPALKYTFLTPVAEQIPGNAAPLYFNGIFMLPEKIPFKGKQQDLSDLLSDYVDKPTADLKDPDVVSLANNPGFEDFFRQASRRTRAGWETTLRDEGYQALLPYLNPLRTRAKMLVLHARTRLAAGDTDAALRDARLLFTLSHHLREDAVLVQTLVGVGIAQLGLEDLVQNLTQSPTAPNLYWALANLPHPLFDLRETMAWERAAIRASIPALRGGRSIDDLRPDEWDQVTRDFLSLLRGVPNNPLAAASPQNELTSTALAVVFYPHAKQTLLDHGLTPDAVDAMPAPQVIGMALFQTYDHWLDESSKWAGLPYWVAAPHLAQADKDLRAAQANDPFNVAYVLVPSLGRTYLTLTLLDRHVAAVQTIEAIRAYAAAHDGAVPPSLDRLTDTPAPLDPTTGRPFGYRVTGDRTAEIASPPPPGGRKVLGLRYVVTVRK